MKPYMMAAAFLAITGAASPLPAQNVTAPQVVAPQVAEPGSNLPVYLLTFGWGDVVWERFGHNAIWIKDRARGTDMTYNWERFAFNRPTLAGGSSTGVPGPVVGRTR